jgi:class 3 adenylate cyclase/tetratricopeptide (TPR) repeat protein
VQERGGERRQMTVMFVDLVGSTQIAERHEPEVVRDVLREYQRVCADAVSAHGGHIAQYVGDGVMVYFGFPTAHEDDPRQAVMAGLDIVDSLAAVADDVRRRHGIEIAARVGVHTGLVLVSDMGSDRAPEHDAIIGAAPNQAARIQALAPEGSVAISDDTYDIVRGYFDVESLGTPQMKGIERLVEVFRVIGPTDAKQRLQAAGTARTPLAGRWAERRTLREIWDGLIESSPAPTRVRTVTLRGEAGIGKSRLAEWLASEAHLVGSVVLTAFCASDRRASRLFPVAGMLERALEFQPDDDADVRLTKTEAASAALGLGPRAMPFLVDVLGLPAAERFALPAREPRLLRERTFDTLTDVVRAHARRGRVLLLVEDAQWADQTTLEWLARLSMLESTLPLLLLVTGRPEFDPPWSGPTSRIIDVEPLTGLEEAQFIRAVADLHHVPAELQDVIAARSDGNPLFAEELAKSIGHGSNRFDGAETIPPTIRDLLTARLDALGDNKQLAQSASVIGREIDVDLLRDVEGLTRRQLLAGLSELVRAGVVEEIPGTQSSASYQFVHALVRDAAYDSQERRSARAIHLRVAETLRSRPDADPGLVAQHFDAASVPDEAVTWYLQAGLRAQTAAADVEAIRDLDRSLELLSSLPEGPERDFLEFNLHIVRGTSHVSMHGYGSPNAATDFRRSLELSEQVATGVEVAPPLAAIWAYYLVHGDLRAAAEAVDRLTAITRPELEPEILCCLGAQRFFEGRMLESRAALQESVKRFEAREPGARASQRWLLPSDAFAVALTHLGCVLWMVGETAESETRLAEATERAKSLPHYPTGAFTEAYVASYAALIEGLAGRYDRSRDLHEQAIAVAQRYGMQFWLSTATAGRAISLAHIGEPRAALEMLAPAMEKWQSLGAEALLPFDIAQRALMHLQLGELAEALADADESLRRAERTTEHVFTAETHRTRASILRALDVDDVAGVRSELVTARTLAAEQGALVFELRAALDLAELDGDNTHGDVNALRDVMERVPADAELSEIPRARTLLDA